MEIMWGKEHFGVYNSRMDNFKNKCDTDINIIYSRTVEGSIALDCSACRKQKEEEEEESRDISDTGAGI